MRILAPLIIIVLSAAACVSAPERGGAKAGIAGGVEGEGITRAELQDALLRFEMSFNESLRQALHEVESHGPPEVRTQALRSLVVYVSSALAIVLGPVPESNLLDLMVFLELCRDVFERYWIPEVYGESGEPVLAVFDRGRADLAKVAAKVLTPAQIGKFREAVGRWIAAHPDQVAVEGIRLTQIAAQAGAEAAAVKEEAGGLLASVKGVTQATDQVALLGERFLYYGERLPFLMRAQARLGVQEMAADASGAAGILAASQVFFLELGRDLTAIRNLAERVETRYDRFLLRLVLAGMALIFFAAVVFLAARIVALKLESAYARPGTRGLARARKARWRERRRWRGSEGGARPG